MLYNTVKQICYVLLCYVMLCYVMLCYVMLCYVMLCYVMLCYVMLCYVMCMTLHVCIACIGKDVEVLACMHACKWKLHACIQMKIVCISIYECMYVCTCISMYVCMYVCMYVLYVCMYVCTCILHVQVW